MYVEDPPPVMVGPDNTASAEVVGQFLEPAPAGYVWQFDRDWDGAIRAKCLVNAAGPEEPVERALSTRLQFTTPPLGYWWTGRSSERPGGKVLLSACIERLACTYGKLENRQDCVWPR
jgi:hypothetical protein